MSKKSSITGTIEAWESGALGKSEAHVRKATTEVSQQIDDALGLQAISIRLPKATIELYKNLAKVHGVGYQPLMRDAIVRWPEGELKKLLAGAIETQRVRPTKRVSKSSVEIPNGEPTIKKAA